ncbi:MAG: hypothetical protein JJ896_02290 [Rhodothermales bacterium]|nr:hypothetical protein [Rhodothermales bacterium]
MVAVAQAMVDDSREWVTKKQSRLVVGRDAVDPNIGMKGERQARRQTDGRIANVNGCCSKANYWKIGV